MSVRVAIVEDNTSLREQLIERFQFFEAVDLVFSAGLGEQCIEQLATYNKAQRPEVILMDIEMPGISGIETTQRIKAAYPEIDIIMFTVFEHDDKIFQSIQAGAAGYLLKDAATEKLVEAIIELKDGGAPMSPRVARKMLAYVQSLEKKQHKPSKEKKASSFNLSARELELLEGLVRDETDLMIADRLSISPHTVRTHFKNIYKKLHVHSRAAAVRVTLENRLLDPNE